MSPRFATQTSYFLNRVLGYLALVGRGVRLPESTGFWLPVADAMRAPWEVSDMLAAMYPDLDVPRLPFIALLTDFDVEEFDKELREKELLEPDTAT
jgi:hypothetical protein